MKVYFKTLSLPPPQEFPLGNENYCNVTSDTKTSMFSVADDVFPFSKYCMKPYSKKNLTVKGIFLITVSLETCHRRCNWNME